MAEQLASTMLEMQGISKAFPGAQALDGVNLELRAGEIHALVGENGAGKSTLIKILGGAYRRDAGHIRLNGQPVSINTPTQALSLGIVIIYQEANLAPQLSVAENIFMGRMPASQRVWVNWREMKHRAQTLLDQLGAGFRATDLVETLSPAQQQMVEIAKALSISARVIVLDEPTASLSGKEVDTLLQTMDQLRKRGVGIVFITHRLEEVFRIADRVTVLRDGRWVATIPTSGLTSPRLVGLMVGRELGDLYAKQASAPGPTLLDVRHLSGNGFRDVTFSIRRGEIVGFFGLVGSGRTNVARALFGADPATTGEIWLDSRAVSIRAPGDAIRAGIILAPEDRKKQGLVLGLEVFSNIALPNLNTLAPHGFIAQPRAEKQLAQRYKEALTIRCPSVDAVTSSLSGGNQQKVVIGKWLATNPKLLILDEPTRGIDIGAKTEVHRLMAELAAQGSGVLMISSELPEVLGMADRILVMHEGRLAGELAREEATEEKVMYFASGQHLAAQQ